MTATGKLPEETEERLCDLSLENLSDIFGYDVVAIRRAAYRLGQQDAYRLLASAMNKVLTPELRQELIESCDPLGEFLKVMR